MDLYITICAWISLFFMVLSNTLEPFLFGKERDPYSPGTWLIKMILGATITLPVLLRVLGYI